MRHWCATPAAARAAFNVSPGSAADTADAHAAARPAAAATAAPTAAVAAAVAAAAAAIVVLTLIVVGTSTSQTMGQYRSP